MNRTLLLLIAFYLTTVFMANAQTDAVLQAFQAATFTNESGFELPYRILRPDSYDVHGDDNYPLVLFLHGAGERGSDNAAQLVHGAERLLANQQIEPAIILAPQCAEGDYWAQMEKEENGERRFNFDEVPNPSMAAVIELLDFVLAEEQIDHQRVYIMGLSMGGMGTFELLARKPDTFAAAIPICGGTNPALLSIFAEKVPLWIFHGADDAVVDVKYSRQVVDALKALGHPARYTEYPGVNHNSWDNAFAEPDLLSWLMSHQKN